MGIVLTTCYGLEKRYAIGYKQDENVEFKRVDTMWRTQRGHVGLELRGCT